MTAPATIRTVAAFKKAYFGALDIGFVKLAANKSDFERSVTDYYSHCLGCECIQTRACPSGRTSSTWFDEYAANRARPQPRRPSEHLRPTAKQRTQP